MTQGSPFSGTLFPFDVMRRGRAGDIRMIGIRSFFT